MSYEFSSYEFSDGPSRDSRWLHGQQNLANVTASWCFHARYSLSTESNDVIHR